MIEAIKALKALQPFGGSPFDKLVVDALVALEKQVDYLLGRCPACGFELTRVGGSDVAPLYEATCPSCFTMNPLPDPGKLLDS